MTEIFERVWESYQSRSGKTTLDKPRKTLSYYAICETCQSEIEGPTEKRVKYLLESHQYWIHERGLAA